MRLPKVRFGLGAAMIGVAIVAIGLWWLGPGRWEVREGEGRAMTRRIHERRYEWLPMREWGFGYRGGWSTTSPERIHEVEQHAVGWLLREETKVTLPGKSRP